MVLLGRTMLVVILHNSECTLINIIAFKLFFYFNGLNALLQFWILRAT